MYFTFGSQDQYQCDLLNTLGEISIHKLWIYREICKDAEWQL